MPRSNSSSFQQREACIEWPWPEFAASVQELSNDKNKGVAKRGKVMLEKLVIKPEQQQEKP